MFQFDLRRLDIYRKIPKDLTQPTRTGAIISLATITFCSYLLMAEFCLYMDTEITTAVYVDDPIKSYEFIPVYLNITVHKVSCGRLNLDAQDDMGRHDDGLLSNTHKKELEDGGCLMECRFRIAKVSGNFHISTHTSDEGLNADERRSVSPVNLAHTIHELSFGNGASNFLRHAFAEASSFTPLDNRSVLDSQDWDAHDYFLKIVPSIYDAPGYRLYPYQFTSLYKKQRGDRDTYASTAIWFRYEMAPVVVRYREHEKHFYHFLTQACAIIGGSFTVSGIIDSLVFSATEVIHKARIGKLP